MKKKHSTHSDGAPVPDPNYWLFDLHCHPALKYFIFKDENLFHPHHVKGGIFSFEYPLEIYYDAPGAIDGGVGVFVNNHYIPEYNFNDSLLLSKLDSITQADLIEQFDFDHAPTARNTNAWDKLQLSISHFEDLVKETNASPLGQYTITILDDPKNFSQLKAKYDIVVINAIEGAHHLGRNLALWEYQKNLDYLKTKGFCFFTLGHFSKNSVVDSAGGIPPSEFFVSAYHTPNPNDQQGLIADKSPGLQISSQVVEYALKKGFLIDLVHSSLKARKEVYKINRDLARLHGGHGVTVPPKTFRPLAFTHTGVWDLYSKSENASWEFSSLLPHYFDVKEIIISRGIIGLILMNYWLSGDDSYKLDPIPALVATIKYVASVAKDVANEFGNLQPEEYNDFVGIGTDLDGFTHVPDDYRESSLLSGLAAELLPHFDNDPTVVKKILHENAMRVFKEACGAI